MQDYLDSVGDTEDIILNAKLWSIDKGKQTYRFTDIENKNNPPCQLCGKTCYPAETLTFDQVPYHKNCFRCVFCRSKLTQAMAVPVGDSAFVCTNHRERVMEKGRDVASSAIRERRSSDESAAPKESAPSEEFDPAPGITWRAEGKKQVYRYPEDLEGATKRANVRCHRCAKTVYPAERFVYENIHYHLNCVKCMQCHKKLANADAIPFGEQDFLCQNHYAKVVKAVNSEMTKNAARASQDAEPGAFKLEPDEHGFDPRMYGGYHWRVENGKQTYRYPEDVEKKSLSPRCNFCGKKCYPAETVTYELVPYHSKCIRCLKCGKMLSAANATPFGEDVFLCDSHFDQFGQGGGLPKK